MPWRSIRSTTVANRTAGQTLEDAVKHNWHFVRRPVCCRAYCRWEVVEYPCSARKRLEAQSHTIEHFHMEDIHSFYWWDSKIEARLAA